MPRPKNLIPTVQQLLTLPQDIHTRLVLHLFSELEGRVPQGGYQRFFVELLQSYFNNQQLDLAPFAGTDPGAATVTGSPASIAILLKTLKGEVPV